MIIDYELLGKAQTYYKSLSYTPIEVPWLVSSETSSITAPEGVQRYVVTKGSKVKEFIASGEQGFLYLALKGFLSSGKYVTITPCLRNDNFDFTHVKSFMKCELIHLLDYELDAEDAINQVVDISHEARDFFKDNGVISKFKWQETPYQLDLNASDGTELGSYGYRSYQGLHWIYGTGLAEPRFSRIRNVISPKRN